MSKKRRIYYGDEGDGIKLAGAKWDVAIDAKGRVATKDATLCLLMDIRAELQRLNSFIRCQNAVEIPEILRAIRENTKK